MRIPPILRSLTTLVSGLSLLLLVEAPPPSLDESPTYAQFLCPSTLGTLMRLAIWATSDAGRTLLSAAIAGCAVVSYLSTHKLREARELGGAIATLLLFLLIVVVSTKFDALDLACHHLIQISQSGR